MAVRKPQTEKKAKGLIKGVGDYKGKTLNLTKKQLGKKGTVAAKKRTVSISNTKYDTATKKVTGPAGKPLTGKVDLGGGNMAVYKNGVRVRAAKKVVSSGRGGGTGGTGGTGGKTGLTRGQKAESARYTGLANSPNKGARQTGGRRTAAQANKLGAEGPKKNPPKSVSSSSAKGKNWYSQGGGGLFGKNSPFKDSSNSSGKPAKGDRRRNPSGVGIQSWNGKTWVTAY